MGTYVYAFDEAKAGDKDLLGGKGANLAEMTGLGLPVPPGFTITTEACRAYLEGEHRLPDGLADQVSEHLARLEEEMGRRLGDPDDPLLVSVRSGAPVSMPGMMDTVLNLGLHPDAVDGLARQARDEAFAQDCYRRLVEMYGDVVAGAEDFTEQDLPQDPREQLDRAIEAVFASWDNQRAARYRKLKDIPDDLGTAVNVQAMVFGNLGDHSGTGVAFTRNPATGEREPYGDWLANAQGEDVVAGTAATRHLDEFAAAFPDLDKELREVFDRLEQHYRDMQDVEFTIERGKLWVLQTRTGERTGRAAVRIAVDLVDEGIIDEREAVRRVDPGVLEQLLHPQFDPDASYDVLTKGLPASPGAATGQVVFDADDAEAATDPVVLVRRETSPEDVHGLAAAQGVLTARGGLVSHAAVVARGMGKPAVCGAGEVEIDPDGQHFRVGEVTVSAGDVISISGTTGDVVLGEVEVVETEPDEQFGRLLAWADQFRRLKVRANADTAVDAKRARELGADGIGLCRTEHMFFDERLPLIQKFILGDDDVSELEEAQRADFTALLEVMDGLPVTVRLLDPPLHEFLPHPDDTDDDALAEAARALQEQNPMLGTRGVRLGLLRPELYRMQVRALIAAVRARREAGGDPRVEVMIPLVVTGPELAAAVNLVRDAAGEDVTVGTMVETPRAALVAGELAEHAEFFSFGTNDLTQMVFGFSRDDVEGQILDLYLKDQLLERNPFETLDVVAVGELVRLAVERGRATRPDLDLGICGEHGGDPDSVRFCHETGLDYVSCSPYRIPVARLAAAHAALQDD